MADADFSTWQKPELLSEVMFGWAEGQNRPANGAYVGFKVLNGMIVAVDPTKE